MRTRRDFLKTSGGVALGATLASACRPGTPAAEGTGGVPVAGGSSAGLLVKNPDHPAPATYDRLPLDWYKATVKRLQAKLAERGLDGILITDRWNLIYFTGLFHTTTERPFSCFIPTKELALYWFHPGLDLELVSSWWMTEREYYYDFPHADGGYPNQGKVVIGPAVDLVEWQLKGVAKRGFGEKKIGLSQPPSARLLQHMKKILPKASFEDADDICITMRRVKTAEEIALIQRALNCWSQIHAFGRDYVLQYGTDKTDFDVAGACRQYGVDLVMKDIQRDGKPHTAVGIDVSIGCRTGIGTAYPHPNQFHHNKIKKGDSIQISGVVRVGGHGGELYAPYQIAPWDAKREKVWDVMAESCNMQVQMSKAGTRCQDIARAIHEYQVKEGMQKYLYQRIAHGEGMEGHQEPFIALGEETVLEDGMTFSMEPGLFAPEEGYGYNPSDTVLVTKDKGVAMGSKPLTKEWHFLRL